MSGIAGGRRVIGYARVSTEKQVESGAGLDAQRAAIAAECDRRGWDLGELVVDEGVSGKSLNRPGLMAALEMLASGKADALVCAKLDRLSRSVKDFAELMDMARHYGWALVILDLGVDTTTPAGEAMANVMATFAQFERRMISLRTVEGLAAKRAQGVQLGRRATMDGATEAMICDLRRKGYSLSRIADELNANGIPTAQGGTRWYAGTVAYTLKRLEAAA